MGNFSLYNSTCGPHTVAVYKVKVFSVLTLFSTFQPLPGSMILDYVNEKVLNHLL